MGYVVQGVVNLDGSPYAATLRAYKVSDGSFVAETTSNGTTGEYTFTGLEAGVDYHVLAIDGAGVRPMCHGPLAAVIDLTSTDYRDEVLSLGPVAYWRLGESSGTTAVDETGNHDGTYVNTPTLGATGLLVDDADTAVTFNGSSQYMSAADHSDFYIGAGDFTFVASFKLTGYCTTPYIGTYREKIICKDTSTGREYGFGVYGTGSSHDGLELILFSGNTTYVLNTQAFSFQLNTIYHVSVRRESGTIYFTINGVEYNAGSNAINVQDTSTDVKIGAQYHSSLIYAFPGTIDEVAIFDKALTADEVRRLYYRGVGYTGYALDTIALGPVAYWRLGEASGSTAYDEMGTYDGTYVNSPTLGATGLLADDPDTAVTFDGTNDCVTIASHINSSTGSIVLSFIADTLPSSQYMFAISDDATLNHFLGVATYDSNLTFHRDNNGTLTRFISQQTLVTGREYHVIVTSDGEEYSMYIDGVLAPVEFIYGSNTGDWTLGIPGLDQMSIGGLNRSTLAAPFDGTIDEVAIFDKALTAAEIRRMYYSGLGYTGYALEVLSNGPVAYWRLGESSGTTAVDEMGTYDGTYVNSPTLGATGLLADDPDTATGFDGVSHYITTGGAIIPTTSSAPFSITAYISTVATEYEAIVTQYNLGSSGRLGLRLNASKLSLWIGGNYIATSSASVNTGESVFVACTRDASGNVKLYVNGVQDGTGTSSVAIVSENTEIGEFSSGTNRFSGTIDEVAIFDKALTAQEVADLYAARLL